MGLHYDGYIGAPLRAQLAWERTVLTQLSDMRYLSPLLMETHTGKEIHLHECADFL